MVNVGPRTAKPARISVETMAEPEPVRPRRSTFVQQLVSALLLLAAAVGDVLISWHLPTRLDSCPPGGAILDCSDALTVTVTPGAAAIGAALVWLVGAMVRDRRGGLTWCWIGAALAFAPWLFAVPGLVVSWSGSLF